MYARSNTIQGSPQRVDAGIAFVQDEVMPTVQALDGFVGLSMLADRVTGRCIVTASWRDLESMQASREALRPTRDRAREVFGGDYEVHEWEVAVVHRVRHTPEGGFCRVVWTRTDPVHMAPLLELFRTQIVPATAEPPGFCSLSLLRDLRAGTGVSAASYEDRPSFDAARMNTMSIGVDLSRQVPFQVTEIAEFEVVMAHLRVPETV
jgi:hypothetical protein